jgi:hypothetical protein
MYDVTGIIHICVTMRAKLIFHSTASDQAVAADGNRILWASYPENVWRWIRRRSGHARPAQHVKRSGIARHFSHLH